MRNLIRRAARRLALFLAPGTGRHRRTASCPPSNGGHLTPPPWAQAALPRPRSPYGLPALLDGAENRIVRPYFLAHEQEAALQERRRIALVLAADFGIDLDQHLVGAQGVAV
ncbi:hypothetical protein [Streptomyces sp. CRN 30]|uniref:hypothetical protein n=1 Tax=Streptomyces sp. CRN 30 TaxID=3075613 RepID=UPI002A7F0B8D|nr:hypothetical protein [Streptomyces sp. CRN 30]